MGLKKSGCRVESSWIGVIGPEGFRPVILPPKRAGGVHCSVKPASRGTLNSSNHDDPSPSSEPQGQLTTWNGQAK